MLTPAPYIEPATRASKASEHPLSEPSCARWSSLVTTQGSSVSAACPWRKEK